MTRNKDTASKFLSGLGALMLVIALAPAWVGAAETRGADKHFFNLGLGDLKAEAADARAKGKEALLIMFEQEGCPACLHMKRHVLNRSEVKVFFSRHFVSLSLDMFGSIPLTDFAGGETTEKAYAQVAGIKGTPTFVFYDLRGREIFRTVGAMKADDFVVLGRFVATGAYKTRSLAQFVQEYR